jgi:uncharacterized protein YycO
VLGVELTNLTVKTAMNSKKKASEFVYQVGYSPSFEFYNNRDEPDFLNTCSLLWE